MGAPGCLTLEARDIILKADRVLATGRIAAAIPRAVEVVALTSLPEFLRREEGEAAVIVTGDPGFYSAAAYLRRELPGAEYSYYPGISSLQYFAAKLGRGYEGVCILSLHGRNVPFLGAVSYHPEVFMLTGGRQKAGDVLKELVRCGLGWLPVYAGENLSSDAERICSGTAETLAAIEFSDLTVLWIENPEWVSPEMMLSDSDYIHGDVPMTKEEIRWISTALLKITEKDLVWDIGAGTGSVSMEMARKAASGLVYAVEEKKKALELIEKNRIHTGCYNVVSVLGHAPEILQGLPRPDAVFVGGSSGRLDSILQEVHRANPKAKIVVNAITLETLEEARRVFEEYGWGCEIRQVGVQRSQRLGHYTMLKPQNPVYIIEKTEVCHGVDQANGY